MAKQIVKTEEEMQRERLEVQLETEKLNLEEAKERNAQRISAKEANAKKNRERQSQLSSERLGRAAVARRCSHRQGGSPSRPYDGKGDTTLKVVKLPDGFSKLIMCGICKLRAFSPHPRNQSKKIREGETAAGRDMRVEKYELDLAEFNRLLDLSQNTLTTEASAEMDCGVTFTVTDADGMPVMRERPCDTYA